MIDDLSQDYKHCVYFDSTIAHHRHPIKFGVRRPEEADSRSHNYHLWKSQAFIIASRIANSCKDGFLEGYYVDNRHSEHVLLVQVPSFSNQAEVEQFVFEIKECAVFFYGFGLRHKILVKHDDVVYFYECNGHYEIDENIKLDNLKVKNLT